MALVDSEHFGRLLLLHLKLFRLPVVMDTELLHSNMLVSMQRGQITDFVYGGKKKKKKHC